MGKMMRTSLQKGNRRAVIAVVALLLAALMAVGGFVTASAAGWDWGSWGSAFPIAVNGSYSKVDGKVSSATTDPINLFTNNVFTADTSRNRHQLSKVKAIKITSKSITESSIVKLNEEHLGKGWTKNVKDDGLGLVLIYKSNYVNIDNNAFNTLMGTVDFYFDETVRGEKSAQVQIEIRAYYDSSAGDDYLIDDSTHTCTLNFYSFAEGMLDANSLEVDYKGSYAKDWDATYQETVGKNDGKAYPVDVLPVDAEGGKAEFDLYISDPGSGGRKAIVGYQISDTLPFTGANTVQYLKKDGTFGPKDSGTNNEFSLTEANLETKPIHMTATGLDAGKTYYIRGVVVTDGKEDAPKNTDNTVLSCQYDKPKISTFTAGSPGKVYRGGEGQLSLNMLTTFNDQNAVGRTYTSFEDVEYTNANLRAEVYFTADRKFTVTMDEEGNEVLDKDNSVWYRVNNLTRTKALVDEDGNPVNTFSNLWENVTLPQKLSALSSTGSDQLINSNTCAFKLVITDLYTGYSTYAYSDPFSIDSSAPTGLQITSASGKDFSLANAENSVVGGKGAEVRIDIGGAQDVGGSGIKNYSYRMYYIPTTDGAALGDSREAVLTRLSQSDVATLPGVTVTDWTVLPDKVVDGQVVENMTELSVTKDGYYRIDARAEDFAEYRTDVKSAYFQVDLSAPNTPQIRLVQQEGGVFKPYDNRTYTNSTVWLFARSDAITGKTIERFEFSTNGGLTWTNFNDSSISAANKKIALSNTTEYVTAWENGQYSGAGTRFIYQAGVNLSGIGNDDYTSVVVRAVDTLTNESAVSQAAVMRTIGEDPKPSSALDHEGIEVAIAMGNTDESNTKVLAAQIKNAAAKKINAKYYGTSSPAYTRIAGHTCEWRNANGSTDASCTGACYLSNCPYADRNNPDHYEYFTPEMVNVQGISAASSLTGWVRYDHTQYMTISTGSGTKTIPTVVIDNASYIHTNLAGDASGATYKTTSGATRYTKSQDRVVYMGQTRSYSSVSQMLANQSPTPANSDGVESWQNATSVISNSAASIYTRYAANYRYPNAPPVNTWSWAYKSGTSISVGIGSDFASDRSSAANYLDFSRPLEDSWTQAGKFIKGYGTTSTGESSWAYYGSTASDFATVGRRIYHMVDMTYSTTRTWTNGASYKTANLTGSDDPNDTRDRMKEIYGLGYQYGSFRDWLFLNVDQPTRKEIAFSVDDTYCVPHANDGFGFLFNTTIRQNKAGTWVLSGYAFMMGGPETMPEYNWFIFKFTDLNLDWFADGALMRSGDYTKITSTTNMLEDLCINMTNWSGSNGQKIETIGFSKPDTTANSKRHFRLLLDGNNAQLYVYNTGSSDRTVDQLANKFNSDWPNQENETSRTGVTFPSAATTSRYTLVNWYSSFSGSGQNAYGSGALSPNINAPRPTVDGIAIGTEQADKEKVHTDYNCYGFGPMISAKSTQHGCPKDSLAIFSNMDLTMDKARKLSEVVNEPQWGGGKAKFIMYLSDNSSDDFNDPVLSTQIQWRLLNDQAKLIGWGKYANQERTEDFIERVEGEGTYAARNTSSGTTISRTTMVDEVATYITQQYYEAFGYDADSSTPIVNQVAGKLGTEDSVNGKGTVFSADDIANIQLSVTPAKYNTSSANPDFPQGRWYIVHDLTGYDTGSIEQSSRSGKYSDALDLKVTQPGRYTVYFAPDAEKVANNTLDPSDPTCIFDFIVNSPPVAQFSGSVSTSNIISFTDSSYDPDTNLTPDAAQPQGGNYTYEYYETVDGNRVKREASYNNVQLNGISRTQWRWELLASYTESGVSKMGAFAQSGGWLDNISQLDGMSIRDLTNGHLTTLGRNHSGGKNYFEKLPDGAVLTVYEKVTDTVTHRKANYSADGKTFLGYTYEPAKTSGTTSKVCQQNLTGNAEVTYAPLPAFTPSTVNLYDTAKTTNQSIILERKSKQTQQKTFSASWKIALNGGAYQNLYKDSNNNWHYGSASGTTVLTWNTTVNQPADGVTVDSNYVDPSGNAYGAWNVNVDFIKSRVTKGNNIVLQITETARGLTQEDVNKGNTTPHNIEDYSARAIFYKQDENAPTAQSVESQTFNGTEFVNYEASNYTDMTDGTRYIKIHVDGSTDREGEVAGYGYYFYERNKINGVGQAGTEVSYYPFTPSTGARTAAVSTLSRSNNTLNILPATGGDIFIREASILSRPTDSLNVAIFAYDNQNFSSAEAARLGRTINVGTGSSAVYPNTSTKTRVEDIKLSVSRPMPPEITATNAMNKRVAYIGNTAAFDSGYTPAGGKASTDEQSSELDFFANTKVTVQFTPRQARYQNSNGVLTEVASGGTVQYQDIYGKADLTGVANVKYTVKHWKYRADADGEPNSVRSATIPASEILTVEEDGLYEVTATVLNGAGCESVSRTVTFTIDNVAPDGDNSDTNEQSPVRVSFFNEVNGVGSGTAYHSGELSDGVTMYIERAYDANESSANFYYYINGKDWIKKGPITQSQSVTFENTGEYTVRVKAMDAAGNETLDKQQTTVIIDRDGPDTPGPDLTATSERTEIFSEYSVELNYRSQNGKIRMEQEDQSLTQAADDTTPVLFIPTGESRKFYFFPNEGVQLGTVTYTQKASGGMTVTKELTREPDGDRDADLQYDSVREAYYYEVKNISCDAILTAEFLPAGQQMSAYMVKSRSSFFAMRSSNEAALNDEGSTETGDETGEEPTAPDPEPNPDPEPEPEPTEELFTVTFPNVPGGEAELTYEDQTSDRQVTVPAGQIMRYKLIPAEGYKIASVTISGENIDLSTLVKEGDGYVGQLKVVKDVNINAHFTAVEYRTLTVRYSDSGSVRLANLSPVRNDPVKRELEYRVAEEEVIEFQMTPVNNEYMTESLVIEGETVLENNTSAVATYRYAVPTYAGEGEDPGLTAVVKFNVADLDDAYAFTTSVIPEIRQEGGEEVQVYHGTIDPLGEVLVPGAGSRTFKITADSTYRLDALLVTQETQDGEKTIDYAETLQPTVDEQGQRVYEYTLTNPTSNGTIEVSFVRQTYWISTTAYGNGYINVTEAEPIEGGLNTNEVPEGSALNIQVTPREGARISDVVIKRSGREDIHLGAVSLYTLRNMSANTIVEVTFTKRTVGSAVTRHTILAVANNVKDASGKLAEKPYRFRISDGVNTSAWSDWLNTNSISFTGIFAEGSLEEIPLLPNTRYTVYVQTRDEVGNLSGAVGSTVYTRANVPSANGATAEDTPGEYTKKVALNVLPNGNPADTEYLVYYSTSSNMANAEQANNGQWATLEDTADGRKVLYVRGLQAGLRYYMQVAARNKDKISTTLDSNSITSILVSPAAPPANTLYFMEQASPMDPVVLVWDAPSSDVSGVLVYRNGRCLNADRPISPNDACTFSDPAASFTGDAMNVYSYAFVNEAGIGSTCVAVSKEYYDAVKAEAEGTAGEDSMLTKMDQLKIDSSDELLFSEAMTYPRFPTGLKYTASCGDGAGDEFSGTITVTMERNSSIMDRYQKYFLTLKAFDPSKKDASGKPTEVTDFTKWCAVGNAQEPNQTKVVNAEGAKATWKNLSTLYEYQVFVEEIRSNGAKTRTDGYGGQDAGKGMEGLLGKTYIVKQSGFEVKYSSSKAAEIGLTNQQYDWKVTNSDGTTRDRLIDYLPAGRKWTDPIPLSNGREYIAFNKSPHIKLSSTPYAGNSDTKMLSDKSGVLLETANGDMTLTLDILAWDVDGPKSNVSSTVKAKITGTEVEGTATLLNPGGADPMAGNDSTEETAKSNPYRVTLDVSGLRSGIYYDLDLIAYDGDTTVTELGKAKIVVNTTSPNIELKKPGTGTAQVETNMRVPADIIAVDARLSRNSLDQSSQEMLNNVALLLMPERFEAAFLTSDYDTLQNYLVNGTNAQALAKAIELLGDYATSKDYVVDGHLTQKGFVVALGRVTPPVNAYVKTDQATYNTLSSNAATKSLVIKEENVYNGAVEYWVEVRRALSDAQCVWAEGKWLQQDGEYVRVSGAVGEKHRMMLRTNFGKNTTPTSVSFEIKEAPMVKIMSDQKLGWKATVVEEEYEKYSNLQIKDIIALYEAKGCIQDSTTPELDGHSLEDYGARKRTVTDDEGNTVEQMEVFKLYDKQATVSMREIQGKVQTFRGVYERFERVRILFAKDQGFVPSSKAQVDGEIAADRVKEATVTNALGLATISADSTYKFSTRTLEANTTYYLWPAFSVKDPVTGEVVERYGESYVSFTTDEEYKLAQYGFESYNATYYENQYLDRDGDLTFPITKSGDNQVGTKLKVTAEYYQADEFGNIKYEEVTGEDGEVVQVPLKVPAEQLPIARQTLYFSGANPQEGEVVFLPNADSSRESVAMTLRHTTGAQGHMVVRLKLAVKESDPYYSQVLDMGEYMDIFVQDSETEVQTFLFGIYNQDTEGNKLMNEAFITDDSGNQIRRYFDYKFKGLPDGYYTQEKVLTVPYYNDGTGTLTDIQAVMYDDEACTIPSKNFTVTSPTKPSMEPGDEIWGSVTVRPASALPDGVYEGYMLLTANHMKAENYVKIHVYQIVGQSTLRGRIYISSVKPVGNQYTGRSQVYVCEYGNTITDINTGELIPGDPLHFYETTTEPDGTFEIPNILNDRKYWIVVKRDGFVTFDGISQKLSSTNTWGPNLDSKGESREFVMELRLLGGDVNMDGSVTEKKLGSKGDLEILVEHYNRYYDLGTKGETQDEIYVRRCDFNEDGVVNALDRAFLIGNIGSTVSSYKYETLQPEPIYE